MNREAWTGCYPVSVDCAHCYFYGPYAKRHGQNTIQKTDKFDWPVKTNAKGEYNIKGNKILVTCFATDFFIEEADGWRAEAWEMIKACHDIEFLILTNSHYVMLQRNLLYTGVTRAKKAFVLVGESRAVYYAVGMTNQAREIRCCASGCGQSN